MNGSLKNKKNALLKKTLALTLGLLGALLPLGCAAQQGPEPTPDAIIVPTPAPLVQPAAGGEIILPMPTNADMSDPLSVNTEEMLGAFSLIFEGLLSFDQAGTLTAALAETWSVDETGVNWTVKLRSSARWHDTGEKVRAADVKFTYDRLFAMGSASYYAYHGAKLRSVEALDDYTLRFTMKEQGISSLSALTVPIMRENTPSKASPVGTGPYKVSLFARERLELTVNENWWKQRPYIEKVTFLARDNNETALASYAAGQLSMVPTSAVTAGRYRQENITNVYDLLTQNAEMLLINHKNEALKDVTFRKALAYSLDRGRIITNVYMNRAHACDIPVAPDAWFYDVSTKVYDYNVQTAKALLAEAGYADADGDGFLERGGVRGQTLKLTLLVSDSIDNLRKEAATAIASQLAAVGIDTEVVAAQFSPAEQGGDYVQKLEAGEFDLALCGFNLARDGVLTPFIAPGGAHNYGGYAGSELSALADKLKTAADEASFRAAASAFGMKFVEELPFIMLYFRLNSIVYDASIQGVTSAREPDILRTIDKWYLYTQAG